MKFLDFQRVFKKDLLINSKTVRVVFPNFDIRDFSAWQNKGYIRKIRKEFYMFSDVEIHGSERFFVANQLNRPSYVWMESALSYYSLIPEGVFLTTSISTNRINEISSPIGKFHYRTIRPSLFWGYDVFQTPSGYPYLVSDIEKTILDFLYFRPNMETDDDFESMRFNTESIIERLSEEKFKTYAKMFQNSLLEKRAHNFLDYVHAQP